MIFRSQREHITRTDVDFLLPIFLDATTLGNLAFNDEGDQRARPPIYCGREVPIGSLELREFKSLRSYGPAVPQNDAANVVISRWRAALHRTQHRGDSRVKGGEKRKKGEERAEEALEGKRGTEVSRNLTV